MGGAKPFSHASIQALQSVVVRDPLRTNPRRFLGKRVRVCFTTLDHNPATNRLKTGRCYRTGVLTSDDGCDDNCCYTYSVKFPDVA